MKKVETMDNIKIKKTDNPFMVLDKVTIWICLMIAVFTIFPVYLTLLALLVVPFIFIWPLILIGKHHRQNELMEPAQSTNNETFIADKGV